MRAGAVLLAGLMLLAAAGAAPAAPEKRSATPNRFGAIAQHRATQAWGVSYDFARQRDASVEALRQCAHERCEVVHRFKNGCAALADGPRQSWAASGVTREEAETKALKRCAQAGAKDCRLLAWACTR